MRRATERTTAGKEASEGGSGKGFYCDIDLDGPHSLDTSGTLCGMSGTTSNHAFVAQLALACLQLWSFEVPVGLTALEIAVAAEFMKAFAKLARVSIKKSAFQCLCWF